MTKRRWDELEWFCRDFFKGSHHQWHTIIDVYHQSFAQIDIQCLNFTEDTFDETFQRVCKTLFNLCRSSSNGYVIAMLGFAVRINEYHRLRKSSWYKLDILINSMTSVLEEETDFNPKQFTTTTFCILL